MPQTNIGLSDYIDRLHNARLKKTVHQRALIISCKACSGILNEVSFNLDVLLTVIED